MAADRRARRPRLPRTVRGRATAVVTAVAALALAACAAVLLYAVHADLVGTAGAAADDKVRTAASQLRAGTEPAAVAAAVPGVSVLTAVPSASPVPGGTLKPVTGSATAVEVPTESGTVLVEAHPDLAPARRALTTMLWVLLPGMVVLPALLALLTWYAMGRALRPVEGIRAEFAEITAHNLQHRVPVPPSGDEVAALAGTMNTTLDQLQRAVARLRTFTSDASHELRGPLTTLRARLELAVARPARTDWLSTGHEALRDTARLEEIVQDLLLLARLDARRPLDAEHVDLAGLVDRVVGEQYGACPVTVAVRPPDADRDAAADVQGSASALTRLLVNLVDNALRHAAARTSVDLRVADGHVVVEVADDGPGIPEQDRERIFGRFTRLDDARSRGGGGTGLGLAIARDIAVAHGGTLTAGEPPADRPGARLVLTLPARAGSGPTG